MPDFTVHIPSKVIDQMQKRGYDVKSWIKSQIFELLNDVKEEKINDLVKAKKKEIEDHVKNIKDTITVT